MIGPNLSDWSLKHRSFVVFMMITIVIAGLASFLRLGRNEDPAFTIRTMVVQAAWPGATLDDTLSQVTESDLSASCRKPETSTSCVPTRARD
ncbi:MAG: Multidrug efflux pump subunit AcrB [Hyphomicrobiales bacterium]|nr:Multidrug efflux pump subunit AcrB [Hyphomicrobiales bacterium]